MTTEQMSDYLDIEIMSALHKPAPETKINPEETKIAWSAKLVSLKRKKKSIKKSKENKKPTAFQKSKATRQGI